MVNRLHVLGGLLMLAAVALNMMNAASIPIGTLIKANLPFQLAGPLLSIWLGVLILSLICFVVGASMLNPPGFLGLIEDE